MDNQKTVDDELADVLLAISKISYRLSRIFKLQAQAQKGEQTYEQDKIAIKRS